jgi:ABC-type multidrug transport system fused ATPase/permease subunit
MIVAAGMEVVSIGTVPVLITAIASPDRLSRMPYIGELFAWVPPLTPRQMLAWGGLGFVSLFVLRTVVIVYSKYLQLRFSAERQIRVASELYGKYLAAPHAYHTEHNSAELMRNLNAGAMRLGGEIVFQLLSGTQHVVMLIFILTLLVLAEPRLTLFSLLVFGLFALVFLRLTGGRSRAWGAVETRERKAALQVLKQSLEGLKEIQVLAKEHFFASEFRERMSRIARAQERKQALSFIGAPVLELFGVMALISAALVLLGLGEGLVTVSALTGLFALSFVRLKASLSVVLSSYTNLNFSLVSAEPALLDFARLASLARPEREAGRLRLRRSIRLDRISFTYPGACQGVLAGVSLTIRKGQYVGLVGETGAGKSTLVDIMLGMLPQTSGRILVDDRDIRNDLRAWHSAIGYVPQEIFLMDDTIRRNVALGIPEVEIDEADVNRALEKAQLTPFVNSLPLGQDTEVGERGVRLSGGQRQRISIARALYRSPDILILDEATAALDDATEREFLSAIRSLKGEITIVSIAHRASSLSDCDVIYELRHGQAVDVTDSWTGEPTHLP